MERQRTPTTTEPQELDAFRRLHIPACEYPEALTPIADLPVAYRKEIDRGYSTGWKTLDLYLQGLRKGEVTVITADTGVGKTTFCTHLLVNCCMQGIPVWVNSWEMKPAITMRKIASIVLRKPMKLAPFSDKDSHEWDLWCNSYTLYVNHNTIGMNIDALAAKLVEAKSRGVEIVMLDHLDYLVSATKEKVHEAIDETVKRLHELAFSLEMHFLLICHPRQLATGIEEVGMHSLKGSASIKQYADNIIILHRSSRTDPQADPSKVKIRIAKNRMFGTEGTTYLFYNTLWDGYEEMEKCPK